MLAGAFLAGVWVSPQLRSGISPVRAQAAAPVAKRPAPLACRNAGGGRVAEAGKPADGWRAAWRELGREKDPVERQRWLAEALSRVTEANWEECWAAVREGRGRAEISEAEAQIFLRRLGECGREKLAAHCRPDDVVKGWERHGGRHAVAGWAAKDPDGCRAWLEGLPEGNFRRGLMLGWFEGVAGTDPQRAVAAAERLDPERDRPTLAALAGKLTTGDPSRLRPWLDELAGQTGRGRANAQALFSQMLGEQMKLGWAGESMDGLTACYDRYHGSAAVEPGAMGRVAQTLLQTQPATEVLEWIAGHASGPAVNEAAALAVSRWTTEASADDVARWLLAHRDNPAYDGAVSGFASRTRAFDPEAAEAWARTIKGEPERTTVLRYLAEAR